MKKYKCDLKDATYLAIKNRFYKLHEEFVKQGDFVEIRVELDRWIVVYVKDFNLFDITLYREDPFYLEAQTFEATVVPFETHIKESNGSEYKYIDSVCVVLPPAYMNTKTAYITITPLS